MYILSYLMLYIHLNISIIYWILSSIKLFFLLFMSLRQLIEHLNIILLDFSYNNIFEKGNLIKLRCFVLFMF